MSPRRLLLLALVALGCGGERTGHPLAYFSVSPPFLCRGDAHRTVVTLDATLSSGQAYLLLADGVREDHGPLAYRWDLPSGVREVARDEDGALLQVTAAGDAVAEVRLKVVNTAGESDEAVETIGLSDETCGEGAGSK